MSVKIYIIMGPNLNLIGQREHEWYGKISYAQLCSDLKTQAENSRLDLEVFQSNHEGQLIDFIQSLPLASKAIVNLGAFTHTSIALRDSLVAREINFIEVHISNIYQRENFRQTSLLADKSRGVIVGLGIDSFFLALSYWSGLQNKALKAKLGSRKAKEKKNVRNQ